MHEAFRVDLHCIFWTLNLIYTMETIKLEVTARTLDHSAKQIRTQKLVPAIYYGMGEPAVPVKIEYQAIRKAFLQAGYNSLVDLSIDGKVKKVLIHEVQFHPIKGTIHHVDFLHVDLKEEITTEVPIEITGVAPAVKDFGGILNTVKHDLEVKCLPTAIPHSIVVDISSLTELSGAIHVQDLTLPKGVTVLDDPEDVVVVVNAPRAEEETVAAPVEGEAAAVATEGAKDEKAEEKKE